MIRPREAGIWALACGLAALFLYTGTAKLLAPHGFALDISYYRLLPEPLANWLALLLPWWEVAAGLALLVPGWRRAAAWILAGLAVVFFTAVTTALVRGLDISCGCFGTGDARLGVQTLLLDAAVLVAAVLILRLEEVRRQGGA